MSFLSEAWNRLFDSAYINKLAAEQAKIEKALDDTYPSTSFIYRKRYADVRFQVVLPMNVSDFLKPMETLKDSFATLSSIWNEKINYVSDDFKVNGVLDYWQLPVETKALKAGDCEDSSSYRIAKAKTNNVGYNVFGALGTYNGGGHYFPIMIDKDFNIIILESTSSSYNPILLSKAPQYKICYIISDSGKVWEVNDSYTFGSKTHKKVLKEFGLEITNESHSKRKRKKVSKGMPAKFSNRSSKKKNKVEA